MSRANATATVASIPNHFGCATTDSYVARGAVMIPMKRATRLFGAGLAPVC